MEAFKPESFFDIAGLACADLIKRHDFVWEILDHIKTYIQETIKPNVAGMRAQGEVLNTTQVLWRDQIITSDLSIGVGDATKGEVMVTHRGEVLEGATVVFCRRLPHGRRY